MRRLIISDIHGCIRTLEYLLFKKLKIRSDDELIFLGDYIDRGPGSREVLDLMMYLKATHPFVTLLRGNHEQMLLAAGLSDQTFELWRFNGCIPALRSMGVRPPYDRLSFWEIPDKYVEFIDLLPYFYTIGRFILVHAGLNMEVSQPEEDVNSMLWIREMKPNFSYLDGRAIIHGHNCIPFRQARVSLNTRFWHLSVDTGAVFDHPGLGYLSALDLETLKMVSVKRMDQVVPAY
jgi:serine/threonine protein phosphatase 1